MKYDVNVTCVMISNIDYQRRKEIFKDIDINEVVFLVSRTKELYKNQPLLELTVKKTEQIIKSEGFDFMDYLTKSLHNAYRLETLYK
jgi:hypothetical protein